MPSCSGLRNPQDCRSPEPKPIDDQQRASAQSRQGCLSAHEADKLYCLRRKRCRQAFRLEDKALQSLLQARLEEGWSPEQIRGRESPAVSVTTIYRAVQSGRLSFEAGKHLRRRGKPYWRKTRQDGRGRLRDSVSIELRPRDARQRLDIGDWEVDTVLGKPGTEVWLPWLTERLACCWQQR